MASIASGRRLTLLVLTVLAVIAGLMLQGGGYDSAFAASKKHACVKKHGKSCAKKKKKKKTHKAAKSVGAAPSSTPPPTPAEICQAGAALSAIDMFWKHVQAAHLDEPLAQQVSDISQVDKYVGLHLALFERMLTALETGAQDSVATFWKHVQAAHLDEPLAQQVSDITQIDKYISLHLALFERMLSPLVAGASCSSAPPSGGSGMSGMTPPASSAVTIANLAFTPGTVTVAPGTSVTWTNKDSAPHTITSEHGGPLASKTLETGGSYSYTFTQLGTYHYYCTIHPSMSGTVVVQ